LLASAEPASAEDRFGAKGQLAITAENLFAFSSEKITQPDPTGDQSVSSNRFGFLFSSRGDSLAVRGLNLSPRGPMVGGHYFVIPSLSIGARSATSRAAVRRPRGASPAMSPPARPSCCCPRWATP
jgi:hypothetical protein